jgi:formylglycine-generating enzyme
MAPIRFPMTATNVFASALIMVFCLTVASAEDPAPAEPKPDETQVWTDRKGRQKQGRFVRLSGDELVIEHDSREFAFSLSLLADESAKLARKLAGHEEIPAHLLAGMVKPRPLMFQPVREGRFWMGPSQNEPGSNNDEVRHFVKITRDFHLKATEVTWSEWNAVRDLAVGYGYTDLSAGSNGHRGDDSGKHPVVGITWWDAIKWCNLLSQIEGRQTVYYNKDTFKPSFIFKTGDTQPHANWKADGYRLPTEAEWEFACRPGMSERHLHTGKLKHTGVEPLDPNLDQAGWYGGNSKGATRAVGGKRANELGLFDMHGNAAEWCWDYYGTLKPLEAYDPRGATHGVLRVTRGGSWNDPARDCRAASRGRRSPTFSPNQFVGFRPARNAGK